MAFRPEPMQRTLIVSSRAYERSVIEALHELRAAHIVEFEEAREGEFAEFRIGRPLAEAGPTSESLVRLRGLIRHLELTAHVPETRFTVSEIEERLGRDLEAVETEILRAVETRANAQAQIDRISEEQARLEPLRNLPLRLEDYRGYESLAVFVGTAGGDLEDGVRNVTPEYALYRDPQEGVFALFVPADKRSEVSDVLLRHGYKELPVPEGTGSVPETITQLDRRRKEIRAEAERAERDLQDLRARHGDFIVAAEEHLSIEVSKAEAPLTFASTEHAFVVDAWVPAARVAAVDSRLKEATDGNVYITFTPDAPGDGHGPGDEHDEHADERHAPPTEYSNPGPARPFQFFMDMFATPKYEEVDPTVILAIAFPLFFGFMIGDLGLGLIMVGLGFLMFKKLGHMEALRNLGFAIMAAGLTAAVFGGFVFKDAFGIPLGWNEHLEHLAHGVALTCTPEVYQLLGETTWGCLLGAEDFYAEPLVGKVTDVSTMLFLSIAAAFVHLGLGLVIGLINEVHHSKKHAFAKVGWMVLLLAFFPASVALIAPGFLPAGVTEAQTFMLAGVGALVGAVILGITEGIVGVIEVPSMLSHLLSYLRLGAVAIAKGAMAISFNAMFLVDIALAPDAGVGLVILGIVLTVFAQAILFVLGVLSSGIQAIRLQYVEFFTKFYKGGGRKFTPFGSFRKYTTT